MTEKRSLYERGPHVEAPPVDPTPGKVYCACGWMIDSRAGFDEHAAAWNEPDPAAIACTSPGCPATVGEACGFDSIAGEYWFHVRRTVEAYHKEREAK